MALGGGDGSIILTTKIDESGLRSGLSTMKSGIATVGKAFAVVGAAAATAFVGITKSAVKSYAEYEQLAGGVETLFKDSADAVKQYADQAYQTAGLSANEYMETVTSFSASLLQSLGGDTEKAAQYADQAIIDMSDNANKMGSSMESIQNAYQGFAKQNYTMLDNLKLGYGGTKEEMQRLLDDASKLSGMKFDISSYADVTQAIHVIQENLGIAGTTALEASTTIQGSASAMKSAWQNLLTGMADPTQDFEKLIDNLIQSVGTFAGNLMPVITTATQGILKMVQELLPEIPKAIDKMLPMILEGASGIMQGIISALPQLFGTISNILPPLIDAVANMVGQLANELPNIIQVIISALPTIIPALINGIVQIIVILVGQLPSIIQPIIDNLPMIITAISGAIIDNLPILINGAIQLVAGIVKAIPSIISALLQSIKGIAIQIGQALFNTLPQPVKDAFKNAWEGVKNVWSGVADWFKGVWSGIKDAFSATKDWFADVFTKAKDGIKNAWGNVKEWFANIWQGIKDAFKSVDTFMSDKFGKAWDAIKRVWGVVVAYYQGIWNGIKFVFSVVKDVLSGNFSDAWEKIKSVWSNVKAFFVNVWNNIKSAFNFGDMLTIGRNIVQGLWNGILNAKDWLLNKIKSFASTITDGIKSFFGIHSPSTVMRDEVGKMIPRGIAVGIDQAKDYVTRAVKSLIEDTRSEYQRVIDDMNKKLLASEEKYAKESLRIEQEKEEREYQDKVKAAKNAEELEKIENERLLKIQEKQQTEYLNNLKETAEKERKLHDARQKDIENAQKKIVDAYDTASSEILSSISTLQKRQEDLANKLSDFGDIMEDVQTVEDKFSKIHNPLRESAAGNLYLDNLQAQTEELENYYETLASLRDREGMSSALFDVIKNMGYEESLTYTKRLLALSDHMFTEYIADWQKKQETTQRITDELFGDDEKVNPRRVLADISKQTDVLKEYYQILEDIKKRADVPQEFFETIRDMGIEEGLEYGTSLLELSDEDFNKYINDWKEKQNTAKQISKMLYKDEADELSTEIRNKFEEVEKSFFDIGSDSADLFENGFMEQLSNVVANIKSAVDSAFGNVSPYGKFSIKVPALAKGAVLPPNKEFLAVVGDQKSGTNVEAPLKTIEQAVQNVIGRGNFQTVKEEHYYLNETELMTILHKLVKGGERIQGNTLITGGAY